MSAAGYRQRPGAEVHQHEHRRRRLPDLDEDAAPRKSSRTSNARSTRRSATVPDIRDQGLLLDLDRADVRENGRQQRGHRDHRLAARDLGLYRAALRVEVRRAGADRADARPADHGRRLLAHGEGSHDGDGRRAADDPRVLALRHDHRVRPCARERAADAARGVLADRQPLDVRGAHQVAGDELLHAAAGARAAVVRRRNAARTSRSR